MCLSWALVKFSVYPFFPFGIEGLMWDVIVLIPDHCLSIYCLGKSCSFGLLCVSFVNVCLCVCAFASLLVLRVGCGI